MEIKSELGTKYKQQILDLPTNIQVKAAKNYLAWRTDPYYPSLRFKKIHHNIFSIRIGNNYRVLCRLEKGTYEWFWIGSHKDYEVIINDL